MTPQPAFYKITNEMIYKKIVELERKVSRLSLAYGFILLVGGAALYILFTR